ncbi:unnamed protein product [marine sediment metagenome]|uniref:Uncharacterized protein n=1 Tax=marine sediment metagenome TaxID=412755 RepID=X1KNG2_9ZZZZ
MTMQIRKTYRGINPEMLHNEIRDLVQKQGIIASEAKLQTYPLPSGATQSRVTLVFKTQAKQKECGSAHIIGSPEGETKMLLDLDENLLPQETISTLQANLAFILGSYELKW